MDSELLFNLLIDDNIRNNIKKIIELENKGVTLTEEHLFIFHCICNNTFLVSKNKELISEEFINKAMSYAIKYKYYEIIDILLESKKIKYITEEAISDQQIFNSFISRRVYKLENSIDIYFLCKGDIIKTKILLQKRIKPSQSMEKSLMEYEEFVEYFPQLAIYYIDDNYELLNKLDDQYIRLLIDIAINKNNEKLLDKILKRRRGINLLIKGKSILDNAGPFFKKIVLSDISIELIKYKLYNTDDVEEASFLLKRITPNDIDEEFITYSELADDPIRELIKKKMGEKI